MGTTVEGVIVDLQSKSAARMGAETERSSPPDEE
jgi:hypothetical protein